MIKPGRRGKLYNPIDYTLKDMYKAYKESYGTKFIKVKKMHSPIVDKKTFIKVNKRLYEIMIEDEILTKSNTWILPYRCGELRVQKRKIPFSLLKSKNKLKMNFHYYLTTGKKTYFFNEHRQYNRYLYRWVHAVIDNIKKYKMVVIRKHKRHLAHILLNDSKIDYFE